MNDYTLDRRKRRNQKISWFLIGLVLSLFMITMFSAPSHADVTLTWDQNDCADYYVVYSKPAGSSEEYTEIAKTVGDELTITFASPDKRQEYVYAVKAFNRFGNSSDFSEPTKAYGECSSGESMKKVQNLQISQSTEEPAS